MCICVCLSLGAVKCMYSGLEKDRLQAWRAFEALERLGNITGVDGLVARTLCNPQERESSAVHERSSLRGRAHRGPASGSEGGGKTVGCGSDGEGNWHDSVSMPGWVWKGDTSSDTVDGHYFAYGVVLDLVARGEEERERVVLAIDKLTSYIVHNDLYYIDVTGEPTKWGRWNPTDLNDDPSYIGERGGNSLQILSFLALAYSVTGKQLYADTFHDLVEEHNYFENVKNQKIDNPVRVLVECVLLGVGADRLFIRYCFLTFCGSCVCSSTTTTAITSSRK